MVSLSEDRVTWSSPVVISDDPDPKEETKQWPLRLVANDRGHRSGIAAVVWYAATFSSQDKFRCELRFRASVDGGATWLPKRNCDGSCQHLCQRESRQPVELVGATPRVSRPTVQEPFIPLDRQPHRRQAGVHSQHPC